MGEARPLVVLLTTSPLLAGLSTALATVRAEPIAAVDASNYMLPSLLHDQTLLAGFPPTPRSHLLLDAGGNDLYHERTVDETWQHLATYTRRLRAEGWRVWVLTQLVRPARPSFEPARQAFNTQLLTGPRLANGVIDLSGVAALIDLHTRVGLTRLAAEIVRIVDTVILAPVVLAPRGRRSRR